MTGLNKFWSRLPEMSNMLDLLPEVEICFITMRDCSCFHYRCVPWINVVDEDQL